MRNNANTFSHPKTQQKIRFALWLARLESKRKEKEGGKQCEGRQYVQNRKGCNYLRVSVYAGGDVKIWGDCSRDVTGLVFGAAIRHAAKA